MKRNALIRIVIWSIVIVVLLAILCGVMLGIQWKRARFASAETELTLVTSPMVDTAGVPATVLTELNVRSAPSTTASVLTMLHPGTQVVVSRRESVSGIDWAFITSPTTGWVVMEYLQTDSSGNPAVQETVYPAMQETVYVDDTDRKDNFAASEITELEIEWVAGDILIQPGTSDRITIKEDNVTDPKYAMVLQQRGNELKITFCEDSVTRFIGINTTANLSKDLTITVPPDWVCESLEIDAASATVEVNDLTIREVDFDGASGTCEFENCTVGEMGIDTASGDIRFVGSLNSLDCDAASASVYAVLSNVPSRLDMDSMSGDLDVTLPEDAGFVLSMDGINGDFTSDFETTMKNGNYVCGDGRCRINVDAMSGDVTIRKGERADTTAPTASDAPTAPDAPTTP